MYGQLGSRRWARAPIVAAALWAVAGTTGAGEAAGSPGVARTGLVINEVLYDPPGSDGGKEYVELMNAGGTPVALEGVAVEAGNGSGPDQWSVQWTAPAGMVLEPGGFLWIGGRPDGVGGAPGAEAELHLQNGPDAVRIRRGDEVLDTVGWGPLEHEEYFEGSPAEDVPSGTALGRVPNGADSGNNASDVRSLRSLTPGSPNEEDATLLLLRLDPFPPAASPGGAVLWSARIENGSYEAVPGAEARLFWDGTQLDAGAPVAFPAGEAVDVQWTAVAAGTPGLQVHRLEVEARGAVSSLEGYLRVGTGPLVVSEIQFDPREGGEWVEVLALEEVTSLAGWSLADAGGGRITVASDRRASPGDLFLFAQDPDGLLESDPDLDPSRLLETSGGWPTLNNSWNDELGAADALVVRDPEGRASDYAPYGPVPGAGDGISLERRDTSAPPDPEAGWTPTPRGATPGREGVLSGRSPLEGRLLIEPPAIRHGFGGALVLPPAESGRGSWEAAVFDVSGRPITTLGLHKDTAAVPAFWWGGGREEGDPADPGIYLVCVRNWSEGGKDRRWTAPVTILP
jgi:hypothetical protein